MRVRAPTVAATLLVVHWVAACQAGPARSDTAGETATQTGSLTETSTDDSTDSESSGSDGPDLCDPMLVEPCWAASSDALQSCFELCECGDLACAAACHANFGTSFWACTDSTEDECPGQLDDAWSRCNDVCEAQRASCANDGCGADSCKYQWLGCESSCGGCQGASFEYGYLGDCELALPGPPLPAHEPYFGVVMDDMWQEFGPLGSNCQDPEMYDVVWVDDGKDALLLCGAACEAFAGGGEVVVEYAHAPCE